MKLGKWSTSGVDQILYRWPLIPFSLLFILTIIFSIFTASFLHKTETLKLRWLNFEKESTTYLLNHPSKNYWSNKMCTCKTCCTNQYIKKTGEMLLHVYTKTAIWNLTIGWSFVQLGPVVTRVLGFSPEKCYPFTFTKCFL